MLVIGLTACHTADSSNDGATTKNSDDVKTITFVHEESPDSVQNDYAEAFKEMVEDRTNGEVVVEVYPVGQLGDAPEQAEQLQMGGVDLAIASPGNTGTIVPENQLFLLHHLFSDDMEVNQEVLKNSEALDELALLYEENNMKVLSFWSQGFQQWTSDEEIRRPEDFEGLRIRTMPSPLLTDTYNAYDANPSPLPYEEVYSSLQLNMIDGQENPYFAVEEMNFQEVQNYVIESEHAIYATATVANPEFYEGLSDEVRTVVDETIKELQGLSVEMQEERNEEALETILESDIEFVELDDEEKAAFEQASEPVIEEYKEQVGSDGAEIIEQLQEEIAEAEEKYK
nr:DctP family TRAP transporter solute-binding subunit [Geomicrobium halophilum]